MSHHILKTLKKYATLAPVLAALGLVCAGPPAVMASDEAGEPEAEADQTTGAGTGAGIASSAKAPWRSSRFTWRHALGTTTLDGSYQTFNPYYAMVFDFQPRWWFGDHLFVRAGLDVTRELTEADQTTYAGEALVGDLALAVGLSRFYTVPLVGVDLSADLTLVAPTSKVSQARTLALAIRPGIRLSRNFELLEGLGVGVNLRCGPALHRYTTSELETPLITGCSLASEGCAAYLNTGRRNPAWRLQSSLDAWLGILDWLAVSLVYGHRVEWLYPIDGADERVSFSPQAGTDQRHVSLFSAEITFMPMRSLELGLGYQSVSPQPAPDSTSWYNPFYNPYSLVFVDLRLDVQGLISQITGSDPERSHQYDL